MEKYLEQFTTREKALKLNLQPTIYGVFAEVGAGQEVVNQFFNAGSASGTIAKSISAYDMTISDSIYGETRKYVSRDRVESMLEVEYEMLKNSLSTRSPQKHFFAFANTIETTNFQQANQGQGWIGIRYQLTPNGPPVTCIIHIVLQTNDVVEQRKIIGELGVNLIYGAFEYSHHNELFVENLKQNINSDYLEINYIELNGNQFDSKKSIRLSLQLVKSGLTKMIMLGKNFEVLQPSNSLYKKDVVLVRGRFRPPTKVTEEMFLRSQNQLANNNKLSEHGMMAVAEITFRCFQDQTELSVDDFLQRAELIVGLGYPLVITNFTFHHELIHFMRNSFNLNSLSIVLGMDNLRKVISNKQKYTSEEGLLELLQAISSYNGKIMVFPELNQKSELSVLEDLNLDPAVLHLFRYLQSKGKIEEIEGVNKELLSIRSDQVLNAIVNNKDSWRSDVPQQIVSILDYQAQLK
ncbi:MAG: hypothetical protein ACJA0U_001671 [Salibacteraceae bacterium]|jgi:hypothetical protein